MITTIQSVPSSADCNYEHRIELIFLPALTILPSNSALGDLFIDSSAMYFRSCFDTSLVLKIDYLSLQIHALARETEDSKGHIYCQLDLEQPLSLQNNASFNEELVYEMQLIPQNSLNLDQMFEEMSVASALHPGSNDDNESNVLMGGADSSDWITTETLENDAKIGQEASDSLDKMFERKRKVDNSIFEDAQK